MKNYLLFLFIAGIVTNAAGQTDERLREAGVCARCHVVSVVEWSMSGHPKAGTDCVACHGKSQGHIIDERNNIKPEVLPHGERIAGLCATCHSGGCPDTKSTTNCQTCHHVHALIDARKAPAMRDDRLEILTAASAEAARKISAGDAAAAAGRWPQAAGLYAAALKLSPHDLAARSKWRTAVNHSTTAWPGFEIGAPAERGESGLPKRAKVRGYPIEMVLIPGGDVNIGSKRFAASQPVHTVAVESFYLARTEVTQSLWRSIMDSNPSAHQGAKFPNSDALPVEQISWSDAQKFIGKLNELVPGGGFRLPTEVEWEVAARAAGPKQSPALQLLPVASNKPNSLGVYDMLGSVSEWCSTLASAYPYDPEDGRERPGAGLRIVRGAHFGDTPDLAHPALRHTERPDRRLRWNGLRIARSVPKP